MAHVLIIQRRDDGMMQCRCECGRFGTIGKIHPCHQIPSWYYAHREHVRREVAGRTKLIGPLILDPRACRAGCAP
jgi:hypothetical protein